MLSLSMIVRDEATRIEACLQSVQDFVDEMVVVDTGSTDETVAMAQACGPVLNIWNGRGTLPPHAMQHWSM